MQDSACLMLQDQVNEVKSLPVLYQQLTMQQDKMWRGRLAPTPSGYLHSGNLMNFLLNWLLLRSVNGEIGLRIDDMDLTRSRPQYVEAIFQTLDWLGLDWDFGPQTVAEQETFSFVNFQLPLRQLSERLLDNGQAYACGCSRKELLNYSVYPGFCRERQNEWLPKKSALRFAAKAESNEQFADDWVIWRRDDLAGYHLGSVWQDQQDQINLILRGADLIESSRFQKVLAKSLDFSEFTAAQIWHHPLIEHPQGGKLSKSAGAQAEPIFQSGLSAKMVIQQCANWLSLTDSRVDKLGTATELLDSFCNHIIR
jgi:glutamyl-tRNA synthetase